jgi:hypothetical protein
MSRQAALGALAVYLLAGLLLAVPARDGWPLLVLGGAVLLGLGLRTRRFVLVGGALIVPAVAWVVRAAVGAGRDSALAALLIASALFAVAELARVAIDAAPHRGAVRIDPRLRRRLLVEEVAVGVLGLAAAAVVLGAAGDGIRPPPALLPVGLLAAAVFVVGLVGLLRRSDSTSNRRPPRAWRALRGGRSSGRTWGRFVVPLVVAAVIGLPLVAALGGRAPLPPGSASRGSGGSTATSEAPPPPPGSSSDDDALRPQPAEVRTKGEAPRLVVLLGLGAVGVALALLLGGGDKLVTGDDRRPDRPPPDPASSLAPAAPRIEVLPPEEAAAVLEDALGYLRAELEPRLAVRCAYAAVAGGLGRLDLARGPAESELEFHGRQLRRLGAAGPAHERLTELFELARFSVHPVDEAMRSEALRALEEVRAGLRDLACSAPAGRGATSAGRGATSAGSGGGSGGRDVGSGGRDVASGARDGAP